MPDVGIATEPVRRELESAPPDGFVMLKQLPYFDLLERRDKVTRLAMEASEDGESDGRLIMETMQQWARVFDFRNCIVDHNLTVNDQKVDFSKAESLRMIAPNVGKEIEALIDELNGEAKPDEDFTPPAPGSSLDSLETSPSLTPLEPTDTSEDD